MSTSYPVDLPAVEGLEIVSILRNGEVVSKKAKFAYNVWVLQGYAQKTLIGDPSSAAVVGVVLTPSAVPTDFDVAAELEKLCAGTIVAESVVPWQQILQWALTELIKLIIEAA
jgi:hypothetical protein